MLRLKSDALDLLEATARGTLRTAQPEFSDEVALTVVLAAKGYPVNPEKGSEIRGINGQDDDRLMVFHAGTVRRDGKLIANGGRVLNVTALGRTVGEARDRAYAEVDRIDWREGFCRRDIGWRAVARELKPA
jgi:phosphoribosylamine--glycine ligase